MPSGTHTHTHTFPQPNQMSSKKPLWEDPRGDLGILQKEQRCTTHGRMKQITWNFESTAKPWKRSSDEHKPFRKVMDQNEIFVFLLKVN